MSIIEKHLDIYSNRYELHLEDETLVFYQGAQDAETQERYGEIKRIFDLE